MRSRGGVSTEAAYAAEVPAIVPTRGAVAALRTAGPYSMDEGVAMAATEVETIPEGHMTTMA